MPLALGETAATAMRALSDQSALLKVRNSHSEYEPQGDMIFGGN